MSGSEPSQHESESVEGSSWKRILWMMCAVQGIMMMAFTSMGPFLAYYIEELGVHDPRMVNIWSGVIFSANFLIMALISPYWGAVADRKGRKLMVLRTTFAISLFTFAMGLVTSVWQLLVLRALQGVFSGFSASATALVATTIPEEKLGFAFGWMQSAGLVGTLIGPLVGGILADNVDSYRYVFFLTSAFAFLAFLVTFLFVQEPKMAKPASDGKQKPSLIQQFKSIGALKEVRVMFVVLFLAQFSVMSVNPILPIYLKELAAGEAITYLGTLAGIAVAVTGVADLIGSPFLGKRSDRIGYRRVLSISQAGAALMYLPQVLAPNVWVYIAARFGLGLFIGGIMPTANAIIGRTVSKEQRGQVYGMTSSATFLGSFAGPLIGGFASAAFGIRTMLAVTCLLYLVNLIWVRKFVKEPALQVKH